MVTIAIALMIVIAASIVAWPFFRQTQEYDWMPVHDGADPVIENLVVERDAAYAAIKDLEFDFATGKLSAGDYKAMRAKSETKAVTVLQELDGLKALRSKRMRESGSDDGIERQVRRLRRGAAPAPAAGGTVRCAKCGTVHGANDAFCAKCGASLRGVRCPTCGTRAALGDKFCARCGARIDR